MLEKSSQSHSSNGGFSVSLDEDSNRNPSCSTSDEERTSNQCMRSNMDSSGSGLCADDPILGGQTVAVDNNLFQYQLNNANHTENSIGFFGDNIEDKESCVHPDFSRPHRCFILGVVVVVNLEDKESCDLLYYGWSEIENFEDVDRMFRSCDSTFGFEVDDNDEIGWFSSSLAIEGSDDALKPSVDFSACDPSVLQIGQLNSKKFMG